MICEGLGKMNHSINPLNIFIYEWGNWLKYRYCNFEHWIFECVFSGFLKKKNVNIYSSSADGSILDMNIHSL